MVGNIWKKSGGMHEEGIGAITIESNTLEEGFGTKENRLDTLEEEAATL